MKNKDDICKCKSPEYRYRVMNEYSAYPTCVYCSKRIVKPIDFSLKTKIRKILIDGLVLPVKRLKETHPDYDFTEKGRTTLIDNVVNNLFNLMIGKKK